MPVEDVNVPRRLLTLDPKSATTKDESEGDEYWEKKAKATRAKREYIAEQAAIESITRPTVAESPFQVKGSVNLGNFDITEQARVASEREEKVRQEAYEREKQLTSRLGEVERELAESKMSQALRDIAGQFDNKLSEINSKLNSAKTGDTNNIDSVLSQLDSLTALAGKLGYQKYSPSASNGVGETAESIRLKIELSRLEAENLQRQRQYELDMEKFRYEMKTNDEERKRQYELKQEEMKAKQKQDDMFASLPMIIGQGIASGLKSAPDPKPEANTRQISSQANPVQMNKNAQKANVQEQMQHIECEEGDEGQIPCSKCNSPIIISEDTTVAVCGNCGKRMKIIRRPKNNNIAKEESSEYATEENDNEDSNE